MKKTRASVVAKNARSAPESRRRETRASRTPGSESLVERGFAGSSRLPNLLGAPVHPPGAEPVLRRMGAALRQDFSSVKIEPRSHEAAELGVTAFARGEEVHVAPGKYRPETAVGRRILGHELTHVAQQRRRIVRPTAQKGDHEVNDEPRFEREADRIGSRAAFGGAAPPPPPPPPPIQKATGNVVQCMDSDDEDGVPLKELAKKRKLKKGIDPDEARKKRREALAEARREERQRAAEDRRQRQAQVAADLEALETEVDDDEVAAQAEATAPPSRPNNTLATLRSEYVKAVEHLNDRKPAFRTQAAVVNARAKIVALNALTKRVGAMDGKFATARIARLDPLQARLVADPIPIYWYKAPGDYKKVKGHAFAETRPADRITYRGPQKLHTLGLAEANRPKVGWKLKKTLSSGERKNQVDFNNALIAARFSMANKDGDHVKDLGFGGEDKDNNYWPLGSTINRRAFQGYNSRYVLHYQDTTDQRVKARPIGGLIGKWFKVKAFLASDAVAVPAEAGQKKAGLPQV